ncbi:heme/hemin ABC transporter substrate-binding protein [Nitratireductor pacificus]|uniref:Periplasmic binding protein n=1 Tax=Nitratireductor pacificus pht-3B TaxID=391937 RepID=K2N681_9HYPH|nr:ABC transporter substrate-binding protein [Nitratireductor pacificus]EKF19628.1 periplasmic binding protein [Nitratireductor pacificus pht-3B]
MPIPRFRTPVRRARAWLIACAIAVSAGAAAQVAIASETPERFPDASRLVSIGGAITEIIYALGEEHRLIARDTTSTYPEVAKALPDVGYMRALSPEGVLSVAPSAVLAMEGSGPPATMDVLEKATVPLILVPEGYDRDAILRKIRITGAALGVSEKAEELARKVEADLQAAEDAARSASGGKRVLFVLSMQGGRIMAAGSDTGADGVIGMAGGVNAMGAFKGYRQVSEEAVLEARPDVVLMMERGGSPGLADEKLFAHPAIAGTPAGRNRAIMRMDGSYLLGFGPRTADAVRDLSARLAEIKTAAE